jgi:hypothetical protein
MFKQLVFLIAVLPALGANKFQGFRLSSVDGLELVNVKAEAAKYRGHSAVRLLDSTGDGSLAILTKSNFENGTIEVEIAGSPKAGATGGARGFIGIAFRTQPHGARYECFYIRPTNGRADDQLRRNHSTQYISHPEFPWERLRKEMPGVYESYADMEPGVWTKIRIEVNGTKARLFVNGAVQPCLIVNDLKLGAGSGQIALWIGPETDGYFSNMTVK